MRIVVFGATGKVGRLVVAEALTRGHIVQAFVHSASDLPKHPNLTEVRGDIYNQASVNAAIIGCDAVVSTLGSWGRKRKDVVATGTKHIVTSMVHHPIDRVVTVTGAGAFSSSDAPSVLQRMNHLLLYLAAKDILKDGEAHIAILQASELDWTVLRSPIMTNAARIFYKLSLRPPAPWATIPRKAVAKAIVDQLDGPAYSQQAPFLHAY